VVLDGTTGAERWRRVVRGSDGYGLGRALAVDDHGNIAVGGDLRNAVTCYDIAVTRFDGATGALLDFRTFDGRSTASLCDVPAGCSSGECGPRDTGIDRDSLSDLLVDRQGRVVLSGALSDGPHGERHGIVAAFRAR